VNRFQFVDHCEDSRDEIVAFEIREFAQLSRATQMRRVEGVAAGAAQGAFLGDFDGKGRRTAGEDSGPCVENFGFLHCFSV